MKLLRHGPVGQEKPGLLDAAGNVRDLSAHVDDIDGAALGRLEELRRIDPASLPLVAAGTRLGPCVGKVGKLIGVGLNYADHAAETGAAVPAAISALASTNISLGVSLAASSPAATVGDPPLPLPAVTCAWVVVNRTTEAVELLSQPAGAASVPLPWGTEARVAMAPVQLV